MKNWMQRLAVFAVLGAILSSAVLVGCGGSGDSDDAANNAAPAAAKDDAGE